MRPLLTCRRIKSRVAVLCVAFVFTSPAPAVTYDDIDSVITQNEILISTVEACAGFAGSVTKRQLTDLRLASYKFLGPEGIALFEDKVAAMHAEMTEGLPPIPREAKARKDKQARCNQLFQEIPGRIQKTLEFERRFNREGCPNCAKRLQELSEGRK